MGDVTSFTKDIYAVKYNYRTGELSGDASIEIEESRRKKSVYYEIKPNELIEVSPSKIPRININSEIFWESEIKIKHENIKNPSNRIDFVWLKVKRTELNRTGNSLITHEMLGVMLEVFNVPEDTPPEGSPIDDGNSEIPLNYNQKYEMEWTGVERDVFKLKFYYANYKGEVSRINGYADYEFPSIKEVTDCLRGSSVNITIHASKFIDLEGIYFEEEKTVKVEFIRNDEVIFIGFVKPDGIYQSFVEDYWDIQVDAIDNLGTLKGLAFVDERKKNFIGKITQLDAISAILHRTGMDLPINVLIRKSHDKIEDDSCPLAHTKINTEQYYKDDGTTIMDCEEVLKSIIQPYTAVIMQWNAEWYIFSPIDLQLRNNKFHRFVNGEFVEFVSMDFTQKIGSYIDDFDFFHVNKNQGIYMEGSLGAFRVNYKYGTVLSLFSNPKFLKENDEIKSGWELKGVSHYGDKDGYVVRVKSFNDFKIKLTDSVILSKGDTLNILLDFENKNEVYGFYLKVKVGNLYLNGSEWVDDSTARIRVENYKKYQFTGEGRGRTEINISTNELTESGNLELSIDEVYWSPLHGHSDQSGGPIHYENPRLAFFEINASITKDNRYKGEFHTIKKIGNSTIVKDNLKVHNGDNESDAYTGTLYALDDKPTRAWRRVRDSDFLRGKTPESELLKLMVEDYAILSSGPCQVFKGDVFGFFPYLGFYTINNVRGRFIPISYLYRTKENITELSGKQFHDNFQISYKYEKTYDLGKSNKPTLA